MARIIPVLVGPMYEDQEVWYPKYRLEEAGFETPLVGIGKGEYVSKHGYPAKAELAAADMKADDLAGIMVPGGYAPDKLRTDPGVLELVRGVHAKGAMVATICHGPWVLISAGIVKGKRISATKAIKDDLVNAGANFVDEEAVIDGNIVSARRPSDLPAFARAMLKVLEARAEPSAARHETKETTTPPPA